MRTLFSIALVVVSIQVFGQDFADKQHYLIDSLILDDLTSMDKQIVDSCLNEYHQAKDDTAKIMAISYICENIMSDHWKDYQYVVGRLLKEADSHKLSANERDVVEEYKGRHYNNLGYIANERGEMDKALVLYKKALAIDKKRNDIEGLALCYNNIGMIIQNKGDLPKAISYYFKTMELGQKSDNSLLVALAYNNIAYNYQRLDNLEKALEFYQKAEKVYRKENEKEGLAISLNNIANIYGEEGDLKKALAYLDESYAIRLEIGDKIGIASTLNNYAVAYEAMGDLDKALDYHFQSYELEKELDNVPGVIVSLNNIGNVLMHKGNYSEAEKYAIESMTLSERIGYPKHIKSAALLLSDLNREKGDYKSALGMYKLHIKMRDSLYNQEAQKDAVKQQAKFEYEKQKAIDDAEHDKQLAIEQEAKEKQQIITYATAGGLGLVGIFLIFVFNRLKVTRKQKGIIEQAHEELEEKNGEIMDSITYAKRIQSAILPPNKVVKEYLQESFILYKPKDIVAGDFYWLEHLGGKVLFAAADCTGHGVPGAMVSVVCNNGLNRSVREYGLTEPGKILDKTREIVIQEFEKSEEEVKDGMDIALCSLEGSTLQYAGANNPLWIVRDKDIIEIKADKQPIGKFHKPNPYTTHTIDLKNEDAIYIFSDGYVDQFGGEKGKKFKASAFRELLLSIHDKSMEEQKRIIDEAFEAWKGELEQIDDVCVIGIRYHSENKV